MLVKALILTMLTIQTMNSQEIILQPTKVEEATQISKQAFSKGNVINMVNGWGGRTVAINEHKSGTEFTPLLVGLKDNLCQVQYWGYLEKGKIRIIDSDKKTETVFGGKCSICHRDTP